MHDLPPPNAPSNRSRFRFDMMITFGDVAMLIGFLIAAFTAWSNLDKRVVVLEQKSSDQFQIDQRQDQSTEQQLSLIRKSNDRIEAKLDRVIERELSHK